MTRTYKEVLELVKPYYDKYPEKFNRFYDRVTVMLANIKPGQSFLVSEMCSSRSLDIFLLVAEMVIIEDHIHGDPMCGLLEFSEDKKWIRRTQDYTVRKLTRCKPYMPSNYAEKRK